MPFRDLVARLFPAQAVAREDLSTGIARAAARFDAWLGTGTGDPLDRLDARFQEARSSQPPGDPPEQLLSDAAAFVGEHLRARHGGAWEEDDLLGIILRAPEAQPAARLLPLPIVLRAWSTAARFSTRKFADSLPPRFVAEAKRAGPPPALLPARDLPAAANANSQAFRAWWAARYRVDLPPTLVGVREVDGFLRSHYHACFLDRETIVAVGYYLGEVGRGLFEGEWTDTDGTHPAAALRYPELDYLPVGRILKMMAEQPEGSPLDEYLRLIPSARAELRKQAGAQGANEAR